MKKIAIICTFFLMLGSGMVGNRENKKPEKVTYKKIEAWLSNYEKTEAEILKLIEESRSEICLSEKQRNHLRDDLHVHKKFLNELDKHCPKKMSE